MEPAFWHQRWQTGEIGFHQSRFHPALDRYWSRTAAPAGSRILVPLCGKSLDMHWLAAAGHDVVGVELSALAVGAFFAEAGLAPSITTDGAFDVASVGPLQLWCGDIFELPAHAVANVAAVYDRASLIAFPPAMRRRYAGWLAANLTPGTTVLLITLDYDEREMNGPPFSVPPAEVTALFAGDFHIEQLEAGNALSPNDGLRKRGLTAATETVSLLTRLGAQP
jgi:thiopurine S-methyltransferase